MENQSPIPFSFEMKVNGSESLKFIPIGKETWPAWPPIGIRLALM